MAQPPRTILRLLTPLVAAAAVAAFYAQAAATNGFVFDDHIVIEQQFPLRSWSDLKVIFTTRHYLDFPYYRPITRLTFAIQKSMPNPNNPFPYHLVNALLAGAVLLAAYALMRRPVFRLPCIAALLAGLVFVLHPAFSEIVYPAASGRETLLPALLILLATWAYLGPGRQSYPLSLALLAAALFSKEQAVVLPVIFLLADLLKITAALPNHSTAWLKRYLPIAAITLAYFAARHVVFGSERTLYIEYFHHPAAPFQSILYSLQTAVVPFASLHYEPASMSIWFSWPRTILALLLITILIPLSARLIPKPALFWIGWFVLFQLPTAQILRQEATYSERYIALSLLALPALIAAIVPPRPGVLVAFAAIGAFAYISATRAQVWHDDLTFSQQWLKSDPTCVTAHNAHAEAAQTAGDFSTAVHEYQWVMQHNPDPKMLTMALTNMANLLDEHGDSHRALQLYDLILQGDPNNVPLIVNYAQTLSTVGFAQHDSLDISASRKWLNYAIRLDPKYAQAHYVLGLWYESNADPQSAAREYQIALSLQPANADKIRDQLARLQSSSPK